MKTIIFFLMLICIAQFIDNRENESRYKLTIKKQEIQIKDLQARLKNADFWIEFLESQENTTFVTATVYNAVAEQCNTDSLHTASMFQIDKKNQYKHRIIAVSRDLLPLYPFGTKVKISGTEYDGIYTVQDLMNKRYKNTIDILINKDMAIGKWEKVKLTKILK